MSAEGYKPELVIETSPGNFQAWLKHAEVLDERVSTAVAKELAARFGGDPSSADRRHFGRLAPKAGAPAAVWPRAIPACAASLGTIFALSAEIVEAVKRRLAEETDRSKTSSAAAGTRSSGAGEIAERG